MPALCYVIQPQSPTIFYYRDFSFFIMFGSRLAAIILSTAVLAAAADPQLDIAAVADAGPPPQPTIATNAHDQTVPYDATSASAAAAATQSAQAFDTVADGSAVGSAPGSKVKRAACDPQWTGKGPVPSPDTASAFLAYAPFASLASAAPTPTGYNLAFKNLQAENNALGYMGFTLLDTYDTNLCASKCNEIYGCNAFNIAFERSPSKDPSPKGGACDQPPTTTFIKCVFWYVTAILLILESILTIKGVGLSLPPMLSTVDSIAMSIR